MKTIIEMAREAGAVFDHMTWVERDLAPVFERFAELVRADAIADEREACVKVCETLWDLRDDEKARLHANKCAAAIRARGNI